VAVLVAQAQHTTARKAQTVLLSVEAFLLPQQVAAMVLALRVRLLAATVVQVAVEETLAQVAQAQPIRASQAVLAVPNQVVVVVHLRWASLVQEASVVMAVLVSRQASLVRLLGVLVAAVAVLRQAILVELQAMVVVMVLIVVLAFLVQQTLAVVEAVAVAELRLLRQVTAVLVVQALLLLDTQSDRKKIWHILQK
jgi:hypothetical protein